MMLVQVRLEADYELRETDRSGIGKGIILVIYPEDPQMMEWMVPGWQDATFA